MTITGTDRTVGTATLAELAEALRGELVTSASEEYDQARAIWNGSHDARPIAIIRAAGVSDRDPRRGVRPQRGATRSRCAAAATASRASPPPTAGWSWTSPR